MTLQQHVILLYHALNRDMDLRETREYHSVLGERGFVAEAEARFSLLVGDEEFVRERRSELVATPQRTRLLGNEPNPFDTER